MKIPIQYITSDLTHYWTVTSLLTVILLIALRKKISNIADPIVFTIFTNIAPAIAGYLIIVLGIDKQYSYTTHIFLANIACFFLAFACSTRCRTSVFELNSRASTFSWQLITTLSISLISFINFYYNIHTSSTDPSTRFQSIRNPLLHYLYLSLAPVLPTLFCLTKWKSIKISALISIVLTFAIVSTGSTSKAHWFQLAYILILSAFLTQNLRLSRLIFSISQSKFSKKILYIAAIAAISATVVVAQNYRNDGTGATSLAIRFALGFDSPIIFNLLQLPEINPSGVPGFSNVLEIWFKPFLKNIFGNTYKYDNTSEYLTQEFSGYHATSYSTAYWQPNNNLSVDLMSFFDLPSSIIISLFLGFSLGLANTALKKRRVTSLSFPFFIWFVIAPFNFYLDAQFAIMNLALSTIFFTFMHFAHFCFDMPLNRDTNASTLP